jgi:predicted GNAT family N-acyltransferase
MSADLGFAVRRAAWHGEADKLRAVREAVFVREQNVPLELEWDEVDPQCDHVLAEAQGKSIGTGRLLPDGHLGRMAVLPAWRNQGVGSAILNELVAIADERAMPRLVLHAQTRARRFYERHGFRAEGEEFMEAGIPHVRMVRDLAWPGRASHRGRAE